MNVNMTVDDTRWGVAVKAEDAHRLSRIGHSYFGDPPSAHWKVARGTGLTAILVGGGEALEDLALAVSDAFGQPAFLLDLDDEWQSTRIISRSKQEDVDTHPAQLLRDHGIIAPGWQPFEPKVRLVLVVENADPDWCASKLRRSDLELVKGYRGHTVVVRGGFDPWQWAPKLDRVVHKLILDLGPEHHLESCLTVRPDGTTEEYGAAANAEETPDWKVVDSILGAKTPDGILDALGVSKDLLRATADPSTRARP